VTVASGVFASVNRTWRHHDAIDGKHFFADHELSREPWASLTLVDE
jgi:hypothetical protein